jgi:2-polyprenyl-3-methyl-5-hydroxy-6-metoxy-1,4-benzoquinol methylase
MSVTIALSLEKRCQILLQFTDNPNHEYDSNYYSQSVTMSFGLKKKVINGMDLKLKALDAKEGERILDVGCGLGRIAYEISKSGADVSGIDISSYAIKYAQATFPNVKFHVINALELPYSSEFDKIFIDQVLEHFDYPGRARLLKKLNTALKPNGQIVVGVPINDFLHHPIVKKLAPCVGLKIDTSHKVNFSYKQLEQELFSANFNVLAIFPMFYFDFIVSFRLPEAVYTKEFGRKYLLGGVLVRALRQNCP